MDEKLSMTLTLEVTGKENFKLTAEYGNTTMETVRSLENAILKAGIELNG